ncbi:MAG: GNAT family N-acetyltransferase [Gammaproteobacteria bacterium]|jgi:GNAT superfamily N-acetyltransferase
MTYLSLERAAFQSWTALEEQRSPFGLLRSSGGYRKRSNSLVLTDLTRTPFEEVVDLTGEFYRQRSQPVLIRIPSFGTVARFDDYLQQAGFASVARSRVMTCALGFQHETGLPVTGVTKEDWLDRYGRIYPESVAHRRIHSQLLDQIPGEICFAALESADGETACCALGVLHQHFLSIYNVFTAARYRRHRFAGRLVRQLLTWGRQHRAAHALLQVEERNLAALALYEKLGFRTSHWYWYRRRDK